MPVNDGRGSLKELKTRSVIGTVGVVQPTSGIGPSGGSGSEGRVSGRIWITSRTIPGESDGPSGRTPLFASSVVLRLPPAGPKNTYLKVMSTKLDADTSRMS